MGKLLMRCLGCSRKWVLPESQVPRIGGVKGNPLMAGGLFCPECKQVLLSRFEGEEEPQDAVEAREEQESYQPEHTDGDEGGEATEAGGSDSVAEGGEVEEAG